MVKTKTFIKLIIIILTAGSCVTQFLPETKDITDFLVVDGLITDQNSTYTVLLSRSSPLKSKFQKRPVTGALVSISDNSGKRSILKEKKMGNTLPTPCHSEELSGKNIY